MFNSKFNLYNSEWLELVFSERNKNYGAYELRRHYNSNLLKALFYTATLLTAGIFLASVLTKNNPVSALIKPVQTEVVVNLSQILPPEPPVAPIKKTNPSEPHAATGATHQVVAQAEVYKPVRDDLAKTDPKPITGASTVSGIQDIPADIPELDAPAGNGSGTNNKAAGSGDSLAPNTTLEKLPEFPGGMDAWAKFLSKNLRYPQQAANDGVSGRVYMSFIVEKDGKITDIQVSRSAGHGFDEEAKRVLKMAPQWKPGIQNGKPVRVRYTIPINFTIQQ